VAKRKKTDPGERPLSQSEANPRKAEKIAKKVEQALRDSEEIFRSIYNNIGIGIALIGKDLEILSLNQQMQTWFPDVDSGQQNICYRRFNSPPRDAVCSYCPTVLTLKDGRTHRAVTDTPTAGGVRHYQIIATPLLAADGSVAAAIEMVEDITDRIRAEAKLRKSELRLAESQQVARIGSWSWDAVNDTLEWSDETCRRFDKDPQTFTPTVDYYLSRIHPQDRAAIQKAIRDSLENDAPYHIRPRIINESGREWVLEGFGVVERDATGKPLRFAGTAQDITRRLSVEEELRASEDKFRSIFEQATDGIMIADAQTKKHIEANAAICAMLGYTRDEIVGLSVDDLHPQEKLLEIQSLFEKQFRGEISLVPDVPMLRKDGSVFYADVNATRVLLRGRQCLAGIFRDATARKRSDAALREREKQLAESQRIAHIGSWEHNLTTGEVMWSDELFRLLGLDPRRDPADFKMFFAMIHPDDRPALQRGIDETVQTGKHFSIDYRFTLRDGRVRIIHAQAELRRDETGTQIILSGTGQDITERKEAEEKIRQSEEFIRGILDTVDEGFIVVDRDFHILTANKAYCGQVGRSCDDIIGRNCFEISHNSSRPCYEQGEECAVRQVFATGRPHAVFHKHTDLDGRLLYVETKGYPVKDAAGNVTSVIETVNNITEKHLLEEERLRAQKLESIGTLAGGIAHDFNNLLQGIFGYIAMAKMTFDQKEKSLAMLEQAEKALHQSVNLTNQLLTFSKGGKPVKKPLFLEPVIENSVKFALSGSRSEYQLNIDHDLWQVNGDAGQLGQVIQNIVLNADQAMPLGGVVKIAARNAAAGEPNLPAQVVQGNYVVLTIADNGVGIPEKYLSKIFDPYFTTKEKGSGLGLATSYSIIRNHEGQILVASAAGKGSRFSLYIPALATKSAAEPSGRLTTALATKARILVMDDEEMIRSVAVELLRALGHEVEVAAHGEATLATFRAAAAAGRPFDIVILDLTIRGGMGGVETIRKLREIAPEVKAVVSSGYSDDAAIADFRQQGFRAFLKKPYNIKELQEVLSALLTS